MEDIIALQDGPKMYGIPVYKKGQLLTGKVYSVSFGYTGFSGWKVRINNNDGREWFLEKDVDAEIIK